MGLFKKNQTNIVQRPVAANTSLMAELALNTIHDGVIIIDGANIIRFINPAAVDMVGCVSANNAIGLDFALIVKLEGHDGSVVQEQQNALINAARTNQPYESRDFFLIAAQGDKRVPVAINMTPADNYGNKILTFRNIAKELEEEGAQTEFVSTASHEMRTPVASIEGYLGLALNPQTATIDNRARQYLEQAHAASQHLGRLFQDLLDVTKLDDGKIKPRFAAIDLNGYVKKIADEFLPKFQEKKLLYSFGSANTALNQRRVEQVIYCLADVDFLREVVSNLVENAIKYTPEGGSVWVNVQGDGDRALINITDSGIGIAHDDLQHIFQKFYRVDNSQTRTIGGTGLGLYLVKQRTEAMGGKVWAESDFGQGSTFYVSLPRISPEDYEKYQTIQNAQAAV